MAEPVLHIDFGGTVFKLGGLTAQEVMKVKAWIGCSNRRQWFELIGQEDVGAMLAALVVAKQRNGENVDFATADFNYDELDGFFLDDQGRRVEPVMETKPDGSLLRDENGDTVPVKDKDGQQQWREVATGNVIPFGHSESRMTSDTPQQPGSSSAFATG